MFSFGKRRRCEKTGEGGVGEKKLTKLLEGDVGGLISIIGGVLVLGVSDVAAGAASPGDVGRGAAAAAMITTSGSPELAETDVGWIETGLQTVPLAVGVMSRKRASVFDRRSKRRARDWTRTASNPPTFTRRIRDSHASIVPRSMSAKTLSCAWPSSWTSPEMKSILASDIAGTSSDAFHLSMQFWACSMMLVRRSTPTLCPALPRMTAITQFAYPLAGLTTRNDGDPVTFPAAVRRPETIPVHSASSTST